MCVRAIVLSHDHKYCLSAHEPRRIEFIRRRRTFEKYVVRFHRRHFPTKVAASPSVVLAQMTSILNFAIIIPLSYNFKLSDVAE